MDPDRQVDELAARCVALIIFFHARERRAARAEAVAEIRAVEVEARRAHVSWARVCSEVQSELEARYDAKTSRRLYGEFIATPGGEVGPVLVSSPT